jgi:hypothetical protein
MWPLQGNSTFEENRLTLVVHAGGGMKAETSQAIEQLLSRSGFVKQGSPESMGEETVHYYTKEGGEGIDALINTLKRFPGVTAAYIKPAGTPPI